MGSFCSYSCQNCHHQQKEISLTEEEIKFKNVESSDKIFQNANNYLTQDDKVLILENSSSPIPTIAKNIYTTNAEDSMNVTQNFGTQNKSNQFIQQLYGEDAIIQKDQQFTEFNQDTQIKKNEKQMHLEQLRKILNSPKKKHEKQSIKSVISQKYQHFEEKLAKNFTLNGNIVHSDEEDSQASFHTLHQQKSYFAEEMEIKFRPRSQSEQTNLKGILKRVLKYNGNSINSKQSSKKVKFSLNDRAIQLISQHKSKMKTKNDLKKQKNQVHKKKIEIKHFQFEY